MTEKIVKERVLQDGRRQQLVMLMPDAKEKAAGAKPKPAGWKTVGDSAAAKLEEPEEPPAREKTKRESKQTAKERARDAWTDESPSASPLPIVGGLLLGLALVGAAAAMVLRAGKLMRLGASQEITPGQTVGGS